jgi:peroxiredoxin
MNKTTVYTLIAAALVIVTFGFSFFFFQVPQKPTDQNFGKQFSLVLQDYSDKDIHLYEYRRQVVVAYAWASWCSYCGAELQELVKFKKIYGDKIQILAVNRAEPAATAKAFTESLGITQDITLLLDSNDEFFKSIGGYAMPETVFINPSGEIVYHQRGPIDVATIEQKLKELVQ